MGRSDQLWHMESNTMVLPESGTQVGTVAYIDMAILNADGLVKLPPSPAPASGSRRPFVCVEENNDVSAWAELTRQDKPWRLAIRSQWLRGGTESFRTIPMYLNDGASVYVGPNRSFVEAARDGYSQRCEGPPRIISEGLNAIRVEIERRGGASVHDPFIDRRRDPRNHRARLPQSQW